MDVIWRLNDIEKVACTTFQTFQFRENFDFFQNFKIDQKSYSEIVDAVLNIFRRSKKSLLFISNVQRSFSKMMSPVFILMFHRIGFSV